MALKLGTTGMDGVTEAAVKAAFDEANAQTGGRWILAEADHADYVVIDMDSLYGPMSWLRLHAAGKKVIGLTSAERTQTDHRLPRPVSGSDMAVLLTELAIDQPEPSPAGSGEAAVAGIEAPPSASTPAPAPADSLPPPQAVVPDLTEAAPDPAPALAPAPANARDPAPLPAPEPAPQPELPPEPEPARPDRPLHAWLIGEELSQPSRLQRDGAPTLWIDPVNRTWHGPATLKAVAAHFEGTWQREDFHTPDPGEWNREAEAAGPAQPLSRLHWMGGLVTGRGELLPGLDPDGQYRLRKWPQTEREYPKHFRIATAMMKGPASVSEVAEASGVAREDVCDFVNANLATGYAEFVPPPAPEPEAPPPKPSGLFGRMRGR